MEYRVSRSDSTGRAISERSIEIRYRDSSQRLRQHLSPSALFQWPIINVLVTWKIWDRSQWEIADCSSICIQTKETPGLGFEPRSDGLARSSLYATSLIQVSFYGSGAYRFACDKERQDWDLNRCETFQGARLTSFDSAPGAATRVLKSRRLRSVIPICSRRYAPLGGVESRKRQDWDLNPESRKGTRFPGVRLTVRPSWLTRA